MKFKFDIECTPVEARQFLGLPDVAPMQETMMSVVEEKMRENVQSLSPEEMIAKWMPMAMQNLGEMQKTFWGQMGVSVPDAQGDKEK